MCSPDSRIPWKSIVLYWRATARGAAHQGEFRLNGTRSVLFRSTAFRSVPLRCVASMHPGVGPRGFKTRRAAGAGMHSNDNDYDVLIAGGGPVGLTLACELRMYGVSTLVVERLAPGANEPRTLTIHARTLEIMDRRDLLTDFVAAEKLTAGLDEYRERLENTSARGHFAGMFILGRGTVATEQHRELLLPRETIESVLTRRATGTGAVVRHGVEVVGLVQNADGVAVTVEDAQGSSTVIRAGYVVGCDGGRSTVRRHAGIDFPGTEPQLVSRMGLGSLAGPDHLPMGWQRNDHGWFMRMPDGRIFTAEWDHLAPQTPVTAEELCASIHRVTGERVQFADVRFVSRFTDSTRLASQYRTGRVLLAGDAAHVHFPAGGQGANLGFQDAVNLGWKLAAACQGRPGLLDTYEAERRPVAERVLLNTRAQAALMRPGPKSTRCVPCSPSSWTSTWSTTT
ncbi:FAD-dependent monooxygenase [Streptomyces sp. cg2]|uniref:FAD-dependent monooxygenase n=1 Tax=Streptomyces sp. cg2 TaxID=3238799 RepID=UPI0034E28F1A